MIQKDIDTTLFSIFDVNELLYQVDGKSEWIMYQLGNISDTLVIMFNRLTNDMSGWYNDEKAVFVLDNFELEERKTNPLSIIGLDWIYTFWNCTWKEVHTKEEMLVALKKLKVKFKLFNINSDFE
jgi:hypothetical protein